MVNERAEARAVLEKALSGQLSLEDFSAGWPESRDPLIHAIFEETEDTVEHMPGSWLARKTDQERFRASIPYKILLVDHELLLDEFADIPSQRLLDIRQRLLKEVEFDQDDRAVAISVREFISKAIGSAG